MQTTLKLLSVLLSYPSEEMIAALPHIHDVIADEADLSASQKTELFGLVQALRSSDIYDAQERFVLLFDRTRTLSLHLFEHVHGESRDRGQAMVDLAQMYADAGYEIDARELPDYLPLFLEFLATQNEAEAQNLLKDISHLVTALHARLSERHSPYAGPFAVLASLAGPVPAEAPALAPVAPEDDDPNDLAALDRIWEEEVVQFGGNAGEGVCGPDRLRTQIRASHRPAPNQPAAKEA